MFQGSITAIVTPFRDGEIDGKAFDALIEHQIAAGTHALVPCGTTGESPTLSHAEHKSLVERCVKTVRGRVPVIAGTGSNSTREAIELTQHAAQAGANAALIVAPYYNKPTQEGLFQHYRTIHDSCDIPIIIYNIPGRSVVDINVDTFARLAELPRIVGVKDATNDLARPALMRTRISRADFCQLSGEDGTAAAFLAQGGQGCISVTSNVAPEHCARMQNAWASGDLEGFAALRDRLVPLHRALFLETSPAPVKYALSRLGLCSDEVRLPLVPASAACRKAVDAALAFAGLLPDAEAESSAPKSQARA